MTVVLTHLFKLLSFFSINHHQHHHPQCSPSSTFANVYIYIAANNEYLTKRQTIFRHVNSAFAHLYCLKFSFKLANFSESYARNKRVPFISVHSVHRINYKYAQCKLQAANKIRYLYGILRQQGYTEVGVLLLTL